MIRAILADETCHTLEIDEETTIRFYSVVPIYREEMDFKLQKGTDPLLDKLGKHNVSELLDISR